MRHFSSDNGDGTYRNPVLGADWSDPDAIRVGRDFYLTASSFHRVPGLPILHSRDLVNWTLIGHALQRLVPEEDFATPQRGGGVWAPALRHHAGRYWIVYPDPDRGLFVTSAEDPAGEWTRPHLLKCGKGLIDPCPLWASDGSAYLVHGWAKSRAGINNRLTVHRMNEDATELLDCAPGNDSGRVVIDGDELPGYRTLEGPKFYERDGWYWIFAPAGGVTDGWQSAFRARDPFGPYEERIVLEQGTTDVNGPHQGAWVTTEDGDDWFLHFQDKGPFGRVVHLQPMRWDGDGWPVIGDDGQPVAAHAKPVADEPLAAPATSDDFAERIGPQWAWQANPEPGWATTDSGLRLACAPGGTLDLRHLPHLLGQRLPDGGCRAETTMRLEDAPDGVMAGLAVVGDDYAWIGLARTPVNAIVICRISEDGEYMRGNGPAMPVPMLDDRVSAEVTVGVEVDADGRCQFFAALPGEEPRPVGEPFQAKEGRWVGAALGLFAATAGKEPRGGSAVFDAVRITAADAHG
ncbi:MULTISPECIES: glycoside hydrolase family 43 protein [Glycomyces]|uniref:Beta-xylosidase n=2 Tax=Glycomyces TaxID=58113 RepID=A0A9X3PHP8_9ACTN|nr:glycoside hydrolase 43 family protein [Glycomyces lechevalierae]MDA1385686.1 family 43 glycosylhydrolase [Glycomyces lechevalierae]MDR7339805.1 beta-xylosidase [Glycomyces lechevalierae]